MNITRYIKDHESSVTKQLLLDSNRNELLVLKECHEKVLAAMQHERLIHLIVTLSFAVFLLISLAIALIKPMILVLVLMGLFFALLVPYVIHYFFLENAVQRWYLLTDKIEKRLAAIKN